MSFHPLRLLLRFEPDKELQELRDRLALKQELAAAQQRLMKEGKK